MLRARIEERFLLDLLLPPRPGPDGLPAFPDPAPLDDPEFSWGLFEERAVTWGVAPFLHHRLGEAGWRPRLPGPMARHLEEIHRYTAVRNSLVLHHLGKLARAFDAEGIPLAVLKGGHLMQTVYPHPSLRVLLDLDLLVRFEDLDRAEALLPGLGFEALLSMDRNWFEANLHHGIPWKSADGAVVLEIHWRLVRPGDPVDFDMASLWSRAVRLRLPESPLLGLACADNVEYLAAHVFRHLTTPDGAVRSLVDLALLLASDEGRRLDWNALAAAARDHGTLLPLVLALDFLHDVRPDPELAARIGELEAAVSDREILARGRNLAAGLLHLPGQQPPAIVSGLTGLGQARGIGGKIRFLAGGLLPPPEEMKRDLKPEQARLPRPLRYAALAANHVRDLVRLGPRASMAAYRLGRIRQAMRSKRPLRG